MTIKVTLEFDTADDVVQFFKTQPSPVEKAKRVRIARPEAPVEFTAPVGVPDGPKLEVPAPVKAAPKAANAPVQAIVSATVDAVRSALREVFNTKGAAAATELLKQFGAARVGEVKPADYDKFIAACGK